MRPPLALLSVLSLGILLASAVPASAQVEVHAHRGGTLAEGVPVTPENSLTAFRNAVATGADVVELDAKLTADGVPVVMHDATVDRTTDCSGRVRSLSSQQLAGCHIDILGTTGNFVEVADPAEPVPTLAEVLEWARDGGVRLNLEIKNQPTDPDFDPTPAFATTIIDAIAASGIDKEQVIVQSFWPLNLDVARAAGLQTSLLTLGPMNEGAIAFGTVRGYEWLSPQWPPAEPASYVAAAHAAGRRVVPFTLNTETAVRAAAAAGVDGVIGDDPVLTQRVLAAGP